MMPGGRTAQRWFLGAAVLSVAALLAAGLQSVQGSGGITLLLSADTEGQTRPCQTCSIQTAPGGMARRATLVGERRTSDPSLLLVDAGNAFLGADSVASGGGVIVAAYDALGYDAVNLSYRDFRLGKAQTLKMIRDARFGVVSCNLLDDATGRLVAKPYVVRHAGGERVAIVGVTERPKAGDVLPHLREQLAGVRVQPTLEALSAWLPKARREAGRAVLLFYGSAVGLDAVRQKFGGELAAILVGGMPSEVLPRDGRPPIVGAAEHGTRLAEVRLSADGRADVRQVDVDPTLRNDPRMESILKAYGKRP
jgi:2',3'-cyclic-nucleotide 2'-phosphodiesterase (5'-nucleotidase family)